jgi:hypothetical protein
MSFNAFGKPAETVDFGGEVDYASYEWFKDPPPRSEVPSANFFSLPLASLTPLRPAPTRRPASTPSKRGLYPPPERHREEYDV